MKAKNKASKAHEAPTIYERKPYMFNGHLQSKTPLDFHQEKRSGLFFLGHERFSAARGL